MDADARNITTSYGLTLVAGLPLPPVLTAAVRQLQGAMEAAEPKRFGWYGAEHLHVTLAAPLRSRHRASPPLQRNELPADFSAFLDGLAAACAALPPLALTLGNCNLHRETLSIDVEGGRQHAERLRDLLRCCGGFDLPKHGRSELHLSCGFLLPGADPQPVAAALTRLSATTVGVNSVIEDLALVHYSNRTLRSLVGYVRLPLGRPQVLTEAVVLQALSIRA